MNAYLKATIINHLTEEALKLVESAKSEEEFDRAVETMLDRFESFWHNTEMQRYEHGGH